MEHVIAAVEWDGSAGECESLLPILASLGKKVNDPRMLEIVEGMVGNREWRPEWRFPLCEEGGDPWSDDRGVCITKNGEIFLLIRSVRWEKKKALLALCSIGPGMLKREEEASLSRFRELLEAR